MVLELTAGAAAAGDGCAQREREREREREYRVATLGRCHCETRATQIRRV